VKWIFLILLITFIFGIEVGMFTITYMLYQLTITKTWDFATEFARYTMYADLACTITPGIVTGFFTVSLLIRHFLQGKRDIFEPLIKIPESLAAVLTLLIIYIVTGFVIAGYVKGLGEWFDKTIVQSMMNIFEQMFQGLGLALGLTTGLGIGIGSIISIMVYIFLVPHIARIFDKLPYRFFTAAVIACLITLPITIPCAIACKEIIDNFLALDVPMFFKVISMLVIGLAIVMDIRRMITKTDLVIHTAPLITIGCHAMKWLAEQGYAAMVDIFVLAVMTLIGIYTILASLAILGDRKGLYTRTTIAIASICLTPIVI